MVYKYSIGSILGTDGSRSENDRESRIKKKQWLKEAIYHHHFLCV